MLGSDFHLPLSFTRGAVVKAILVLVPSPPCGPVFGSRVAPGNDTLITKFAWQHIERWSILYS